MSASTKKKLRKEQAAAELTEKQLKQAKEAKKNKTYTAIFCTVIALVLVVGLVMFVSGWINTSGIVQRATTALTVGEHDISGAELNYFYIDAINYSYNDWYERYGDYVSLYTSMMGLDMTLPLNEQTYDEESGQTWADYFADLAVDEAVSAYALYDLAKEAGYEMTEEEKASITSAMQTMQTYADNNNVTLGEYMKTSYGNGATVDSFREYLEVVTLSSSYSQHIYDGLTFTQEEINAHSEANFINYTSFSYLTFQVNPNEFTSLFCTAEEGDTEHVHTDEENAAALAAAAEAANALAEGDSESLEALNDAIRALDVYKDSEEAVASESLATLYGNIPNEDIQSWLADSSRRPGEKTVIANTTSNTAEDGTVTKTPYAYTVVMFLERNDNTDKMVDIRHILKSFTSDNSTEATQEQKDAAKTFIESVQESWINSGKTEDNFEKLAIANSTDSGSASNGGLYTNVFRGQMVTNFDNWCFDETRKAGDYGIVDTKYGYHLIYYVRQCDQTYRDYMIENELRNTAHDTWHQGIIDKVNTAVHSTSQLTLDLVLMRGSY